MQTTLTLDDALLSQASAVAGIEQPGPLIHFALQALIDHAPKESPAGIEPQTRFVVTGPFMRSKPGLWDMCSPGEALADLEEQDFIEQQERVARGETL